MNFIDVSYGINIISELYEKYKNDPYMSLRTHNYVCFQLPNILNNMDVNYRLKMMRTEELTNDKDVFVKSFMNNNRFFYSPNTEIFFYYDGVHYRECTEDEILHDVLTTITKDNKDKELMSWKYKTKVSIMKKIKENVIFKTIPESETIQSIIMSFFPIFFKTKTETKYFLTVLGDNILKKNTHLIHYMPNDTKKFIKELNICCQKNMGVNLNQTFRYKYHDEHLYENCRLVNFLETIKYENIWSSLIDKHALNILCVACHYSNRFGNSDEYTENCQDNCFATRVFYLKNKNENDLIELFISEYLKKTENNLEHVVSWKNLLYLWKHFLNSKQIPTIMYQSKLKSIITEKLQNNYNENADMFIGIFSKHLPEIQKFVKFWEENMIIDENEIDLEIDEICCLFNKWKTPRKENTNIINDTQILDLIKYFYPDTIICNEKYIQKIKCELWDKKRDIFAFLEILKKEKKEMNSEQDISIYDAYNNYCHYCSNDNRPVFLIANKSYFEKMIFEKLREFVIDLSHISNSWIYS